MHRSDQVLVHGLDDKRHKRRQELAERGQHGKGSNKAGRSGNLLDISVPTGTLIRRIDTSELIGDILIDGQRLLVASGGRGGRGNSAFTSSTNRAPRRCEEGFPGEEIHLQLELKLIADVGFLGLPNAGKSTLLSRITAA